MRSVTTPDSLASEHLPRLLLRYALPSIVAMTSTSLYNIADSIFIGHGVGPLALSALALTLPLMNVASAFGSMVGIGAAAVVSIRLGQGRRQAAGRTLGNAVLLNGVIAALFTLLSLRYLDAILLFFGADERTLPYARDFMQVLLPGLVVTHLYLSLNEVLRASGYPRKAMGIMLTAVGLNCVLNPLFIFVFGWGVRGSAAATLIAQAAALSVSLSHFLSRKSYLRFEAGIFRLSRRIAGAILAIGLAPFLLHLCASVVVVLVNKALKDTGGNLYIGAYGIINRVALLFLMVVSGLNQGMQPIVGYNYGAGRYDRVLRTLKMTVLAAVCVTTAGFLVGQLCPRWVALLFVGADGGPDAAQLTEAAREGLRIVLVMFPFVGFQIVTSNFFQYIGKPRKAILLSLTRQMLFLVPLLLVLPHRFGYRGVWWAMPVADTTASLLAAVLLFFQVRSLRREAQQNI